MDPEEKIVCETPTPGKQPTRIPRWKYMLLREKILAIVPTSEPGFLFKALSSAVGKQLTAQEQKQLGSVGWHVTTVKLDMEVKGELQRVPGVSPQRLIKVES